MHRGANDRETRAPGSVLLYPDPRHSVRCPPLTHRHRCGCADRRDGAARARPVAPRWWRAAHFRRCDGGSRPVAWDAPRKGRAGRQAPRCLPKRERRYFGRPRTRETIRASRRYCILKTLTHRAEATTCGLRVHRAQGAASGRWCRVRNGVASCLVCAGIAGSGVPRRGRTLRTVSADRLRDLSGCRDDGSR